MLKCFVGLETSNWGENAVPLCVEGHSVTSTARRVGRPRAPQRKLLTFNILAAEKPIETSPFRVSGLGGVVSRMIAISCKYHQIPGSIPGSHFLPPWDLRACMLLCMACGVAQTIELCYGQPKVIIMSKGCDDSEV